MQVLPIDQLVGQVLGNYRIERFLGKGRFNVIYLGRHLASQRLEALTMYLVPSHVSNEANARFLTRFRKESAKITKLDHPHILHVYEYGEYAGTPYLVTPYVTQGSLADLLKRDGRYDHVEIVPVLEQLASGIAFAHSKGYIHGTLRPSNVVVRDQDTLQIAGFGLMHVLQLAGIEKSEQPYAHLLTVGQTFLASPQYIAPEVVQGKVVDVRSDIYALGCMLFELLCGRPPFTGSDPFEVARQHLTQDIPSLRTLCPEVPVVLISVVNQALERDPARRFQQVEELAEAFIQASRGASPGSAQKVQHSLEEGQNWSEKAQMFEQLQEMSPDRYGMSNAGRWQLLPPIITGKLTALQRPSMSVEASPISRVGPAITTDQLLYQSQPAAVTLPPLVPAQPPVSTAADVLVSEVNGAYSASVRLSYPTEVGGDEPLASIDSAIPSQPTPVATGVERRTRPLTTAKNNSASPVVPEPAVSSMPGVYEDKNELVQSYAWWSQSETVNGGQERGKPLSSTEKREERVQNAQSAQIPPTRQPLLVPSSDGWMSEPVAPLDGRRDFGSSTKKRSNVKRRGVVAFLAAGGVVAAGTAVALNFNYLQHLLVLTKQVSTAPTNRQANNAPTVNTQPTQPNTQPTQPNAQPTQPNTNTQPPPPNNDPPKTTGTVIGNTKQMPNSAVTFINPASGTPGLLVRLASGTFVAYDKACTHQNVPVNYDPATQKFVCPAHGAIFDPANGGAVLKGPARLPLAKMTVQVQADGNVTIV